MKEQIINFELAKLAKDKGFDVESLYFYTKPNSKMYAIDEKNRAYKIKNTARELYECGKHAALNRESVLLAPTQGLLQKWLREVHHIYVVSISSNVDESDNKKHMYEISYKNKLRLMWGKYDYFDTYEDALEAGLTEAIKLIDNGDKNKV